MRVVGAPIPFPCGPNRALVSLMDRADSPGATYSPLCPDLFGEHLGGPVPRRVAASSGPVGRPRLERQYSERLRSRRFEIERGSIG
jgi:hypothetical protein